MVLFRKIMDFDYNQNRNQNMEIKFGLIVVGITNLRTFVYLGKNKKNNILINTIDLKLFFIINFFE